MLPKRFRVVSTRDFKTIAASGRSFFSPHLRIRFLKTNAALSRFTVVVSNRVSKKAVERNRLRRRIIEQIRSVQPKLAIGYDVVIFPNIQTLKTPPAELRQELVMSLKKIRLLS